MPIVCATAVELTVPAQAYVAGPEEGYTNLRLKAECCPAVLVRLFRVPASQSLLPRSIRAFLEYLVQARTDSVEAEPLVEVEGLE